VATGEIFPGTDAGEFVSPTGPTGAGTDTGSASDASVTVSPLDSDTVSGADTGTVSSGVRIGDSDSSHLPVTTPQDADGGSVTELASIAVTLCSPDTCHLADGK
jgi:hypothetical protein